MTSLSNLGLASSMAAGATILDGPRAAAAVLRASASPDPLTQYQGDPVAFAVDVMGIAEHTIRWSLNDGYDAHRWDGTADPLATMLEALAAGEDVAAESGTGTGKSFVLGAVVYPWFLACWEGARVFTFAPKEDQLRLFSWMEFGKVWPRFQRRFPMATMTDLRVRMVPGSDEWGAWGYPVAVRANQDVAVNAAGMHAEHMLLVYEETPGIDPAVLEAGRQTCTDDHNLMLAVGNPDHQADALHLQAMRPGVRHIRISALDHPNVVTESSVVPGAVGARSVRNRIAELGEGHRLVKSRVRGISPEEAEDALIRMDWIQRCVDMAKIPERAEELRAGLPGLGADIAASEAGDEAAICRGIGAFCEWVSSFPCPDPNALAVKIGIEMATSDIDAMHVGVDNVGVGAGPVGRLKEMGLFVQALNGGAKPVPMIDEDVLRERERSVRREELFYNLRAQMWWQARLDLQYTRVGIPDDPELHRDLVTPSWESRNGKILVQSKEAIKATLGRSPNKGDAFVYWNFVRHRRKLREEEKPVSAFDPEVLAYEAREGRRVRSKPPVRKKSTDPTAVEWIP